MLGHAPTRELAQAGDGEQPSVARRLNPSEERHPTLARRHADDGVGAHPAADGDARVAPSVRVERQGDRAGAVPPPANQAAGPHHEDRLARPASVPPHLDHHGLQLPAADIGPRTCRSTTPCPTMTTRPPTGRAAASQQGQVPGRAAAHVGICAIQDLIPSALATNLVVLRVCSMACEARRRGARPAKDALSVGLLLLRPRLYKRRDAMAITPGSPVVPGDPSGYRLATMPIVTPISAWARVR